MTTTSATTTARPTTQPEATTRTVLDPIARALAGDVGALYEIVGAHPQGSETDLLLYKWFAIAADAGSEEAAEALEDMLETSTLRYDDDHGAQGDVHFELALEYLTGTGGLPRDLAHGAAHLREARRCDYPEQIQDGAKLLAEARTRLDAEALAAFDGVYDGQPFAQGGGDEGDEDDDDEEDYG